VIGDKPLEVGQLFGQLAVQLRGNAVPAIAAVAALTAVSLAIEAYAPAVSIFVEGFASLIAQYYVTRFALSAADLVPPDPPARFVSFWGMNIITNIAITLGCLLLVLPGAYLAARWFVAGPIILAEDKTAGEGMSESWELMRPSAWPVVGAILLLFLVGFGAGLLPFFHYGE